MTQLLKWLFRGIVGIVGIMALTLAFAYFLATRSLPDYAEAIVHSGVQQPFEVVRDTANVPHVLAQTDHDAFFGLGYAHATDRLWQMTLLRRTVQGRLSELFGPETVQTDTLMRILDLYGLAVSSVSAQTPQALEALNAYSDGVNARIDQVNEAALGRGAPEFFLFSNAIAPWQPADSLAILKLLALQQTDHAEREVLTARTSLILSPEQLDEVVGPTPGPGVSELPNLADLMATLPKYAAKKAETSTGLRPQPSLNRAGASNAWAAASSRSAAGGAILANDPHLAFSAPTLWYLARIDLRSGGVIGASIPGAPMIFLGRNSNLGWGVTASYADTQDFFFEEIDAEDPSSYRTPNGSKPFEMRQSIIRVKGAPSVTIDLRWTENGPVFSGGHYELETLLRNGFVASLAWTALNGQDTSFSAGLALMQSRTIDTALSAMRQSFVAPAFNLILADENDVALTTIGHLPKRDARHQTQGRMPSPGWISENRWQGKLSNDEIPLVTKPEGGLVGNTNNKITDAAFPENVSFHYGDTQRIQRWSRLMQAREVHTRESFIEAQLDTVSVTARTLLPLVGADLWFADEAAPEGTRARQRKRALDLLANWNGEMNEHLPEPLIYQAWMGALYKRLIQDELGPLVQEYTQMDPIFIERVFRNVDTAGQWCDVVQSAPVETCTQMASLALDDALQWIEDRYGRAFESLRWGDAHQAMHDHPVLGKVPVLGLLVNIRQSVSGGDHTLQRGLTLGHGPNPFFTDHGPVYRGVYDFADPDSSVFITSTGQSGHPFSRHYDDLGALWRRGEYIPMSLDPDLARAAAVGISTFRPAP